VDTILVSAGVLIEHGRVLLTQRKAGTHLAGAWEFPGGKCEPGESLEVCLARELMEELAVECTVGRPILVTRHVYAERTVELHFFATTLSGDPVPQLGQEMRWASRGDLGTLPFPEADRELIQLLMARTS